MRLAEWPVRRRSDAMVVCRSVARGPLIIEQLVLRFPDPPAMTGLMHDIERILRRLTVSAAPMPNNPVLGTLAGNRGRSSAQRALLRLVEVRRIRIEERPGQRRVCIGGQWTGWGEARPGHAPYSLNAKGAPKPAQPIIARAPNSPPRAPSVRYEPPKVTPALTCQWPLWADGERPDGRYCGAAATHGWSWCATHRAAVFEMPTRKAQPWTR